MLSVAVYQKTGDSTAIICVIFFLFVFIAEMLKD